MQKLTNVSEMPQICIAYKDVLPESIRNAEIIDEIILEIYNGWQGQIGEIRVKDALSFIAARIPEYAKVTGKTDLEFLTFYAKNRRVNYTNWFNESYLPDLSDIMVFETTKDFKEKFPSGKYKCSACEGITTDAQECNSGVEIGKGKNKSVCNWKTYGLFRDMGKGIKVLIKEHIEEIPKPITIFKPIEIE